MNGNGIWIFHASPAPIERADEWHDKVDVTSKAFMGLTVGCARCHDHKYDAIYHEGLLRDGERLRQLAASSPTRRCRRRWPTRRRRRTRSSRRRTRRSRSSSTRARTLYAQMLFSQAEDYMMAAWKLGSREEGDGRRASPKTPRSIPSCSTRWVRFLKKKPDNYPALKAVAGDGGGSGGTTRRTRRSSPRSSSPRSPRSTTKRQKLEKENEFTLAQVKGPSAFDKDEESKDPFDPLPNGKKRRLNAYQIDLKSLEREELAALDATSSTATCPRSPARTTPTIDRRGRKPGLLKLTDGALERRLSADLKLARQSSCAPTSTPSRRRCRRRPPAVYGIERGRAAVRPEGRSCAATRTRSARTRRARCRRSSEQRQAKLFTKGSGRLELAEEIIKQPITVARRSSTASGGGTWAAASSTRRATSAWPATRRRNPELLDYLASKFIADGMSWKKLHKDILMSRTYQLSAAPVAANVAKDPDNRFFWRANRDARSRPKACGISLLQASGTLDLNGIGGPSDDLTEKMKRRGVYAKVSRMYPGDFQATFDLPTATISDGEALRHQRAAAAPVLPEQRAGAQAGGGARRTPQVGGDDEAQVKKAFELIYQRDADARGARSVDPVRRDAGVSGAAAGGAGQRSRREAGARREEQGRQGRAEAAAGFAAPVVLLGAAQLERIPVHRLTRETPAHVLQSHLQAVDPPPGADAASAAASASSRCRTCSTRRWPRRPRRTPCRPAATGGVLKQLHFKPRAKRVIFLFMNGGMSHVDTFDHKPMLDKYDGKPMPGGPILTQRKTGNLMKSPFKFQKHGKSGLEMSELWPHLGSVADDICVIKSM